MEERQPAKNGAILIDMKFAYIDDIKTAYRTAGQGSHDVVLVHGWGASGRMWLRSMWPIRRDYRLWAIDLPGFGRSDAPDVDWYSTERYADHVAALCEQLGVRRCTVVGHSMGGRIVLDLARRYPHMVERVVSISPSLTGRLGLNLDLLLAGGVGRVMVNLSQHVWPVALVNAMSQYLAPRYLGSEGLTRAISDFRRASREAIIGGLQAMVGEDYSPHLGEIGQPVLLICGARDTTVPPDDSRMAAKSLPNARLLMLERVHHLPTDEAPAVCIDALRSFLQEDREWQPEVI